MRLATAAGILNRRITQRDFAGPRGQIFVIGHMRCFSSLLSHQIGSNPEVAGYCEAHQKYRSRLDLLELEDKIVRFGGHSPRGRFLFDKILHPAPLRDAVLLRDDLKVIFMVREPVATIRSILNIRSGGIATSSQASDYYAKRLEDLCELLLRRKGRALFLEAEALIEDCDRTLTTIGQYLGLSVPLTRDYKTFPMTGKPKFGDPSEWIRRGTVVPHRETKRVECGTTLASSRVADQYKDFCEHARTVAECTIPRTRAATNTVARTPTAARASAFRG